MYLVRIKYGFLYLDIMVWIDGLIMFFFKKIGFWCVEEQV